MSAIDIVRKFADNEEEPDCALIPNVSYGFFRELLLDVRKFTAEQTAKVERAQRERDDATERSFCYSVDTGRLKDENQTLLRKLGRRKTLDQQIMELRYALNEINISEEEST